MSTILSIDQQDSARSEEFSLYGTSASSIAQIRELNEVQNSHSLTTIRIMHSLNLKSMQGVERFFEVVELNLSSNAIEKMEALNGLSKLKVLNLSCNRIRKIDGLTSLTSLERLVLSSNRITSLQPLTQIHGNDYNLKYLDLKDNKISSLGEIKYLGGIINLQEVSLMMEDESNPIFSNLRDYVASFKPLPNFRTLQRIDGRNVRDLLDSVKENIQQHEELENSEEEEEQKQYNGKSRTQIVPEKYQTMTDKKGKTVGVSGGVKLTNKYASEKTALKDANNRKNQRLRERSASPENVISEADVQEMEKSYQQQIKNLHEKLEQLYKDQKELIHKYEMNDKYWTNRCSKLEETMLELTQENRDLHVKNVKLRGTMESQNREVDELTRSLSDLKSKKDKKEDLIEEQQKRIGELLRENGEYNRELALRLEEISRLKDNLNAADCRIAELKAVIRENEKNLTQLHTQTLEHNTVNIQRSEELQRKYEDLERQLEEKTKEIKRVADKNAELVGIVSDWEKRNEEKVNEVLRGEQIKVRNLENDYKDKIEEMEKAHEKEIVRNEEKFKESMDLLEEEFKKVLLENNDKFKQLKAAFEEKCKAELELKQLVKVIGSKNIEFERIIEEQNSMLKKMKEEYINILKERDAVNQNVDERMNAIKAETQSYQAKIEQLQSEKEMATKLNNDLEEQLKDRSREIASSQKRITDLETSNQSLKAEVEKWKTRAIALEDKEDSQQKTYKQQIEDLKDTITTKNRMLEDKNQTIKELKEQMALVQDDMEYYKSSKNETENLRNELEREKQYSDKLKKKVDKASDHIAELKQTIATLEEEFAVTDEANKELKAQLEKKNQTLELIENEVKILMGKQDGEMREKDIKIKELEHLLDECREALIKKKEVQHELEEQFRKKLEEFEGLTRFKDKEIRELKARLSENEEEMKFLVYEIERQRKQAKENIEKLNQLFK